MGTRERHLSFIETYFVGNDGLTQMAGGWHCRTDGKQLFQHLCHHCKRSLGFAQQLSILGYNSRAKTISALQEVPAVIKIYWPILRFRMKYFKGKQSLTEQRITEHSPFLNTTDFLLMEIHSLWPTDKLLMASSSICKACFILVQHTLQLFIEEARKSDTETIHICMALYFVLKCLVLNHIKQNSI